MQYYDEKMLHWSKTRKRSEGEIVNDAEKLHRKRKEELGPRVQVLRVAIRQYYRSQQHNMEETDFCKKVEAQMDNMLKKYEYDLEKLVDAYRSKIVSGVDAYPLVCPKCRYRPLFCLCDPTSITNELKDFKPDLSLKKEKAHKVLKLTASKEFNAGQKTLFDEMYGERND